MDKYCFITIDTEEDEWGDYGLRVPSVKNIACLKQLQKLFDVYGAIPTYLIDYPVATRAFSRRVMEELLGQGKCEIGTHCHPWNTPPFIEKTSDYNSFLSNLPQDLVAEKMIRLHEIIKINFGITSQVFRAGRWGFGNSVLSTLEKLNYAVDTSITPFRSWEKYEGPDFSRTGNECFYLQQNDAGRTGEKDDANILEVPPTMGYLQQNEIFCNQVRKIFMASPIKYFKLNGFVDFVGILNYRWLSPETSTSDDMISLVKNQFAKGNNFVNMFFHSNSLIPGQTPFVLTSSELKAFYKKIELFLLYLIENNIHFVSLSHGVRIKNELQDNRM